MTGTTSKLTPEQRAFYEKNGYLYPLRVFSDAETAAFRQQFDDFTEENKERLRTMIPRERRSVYGLTHLSLPWVYQIASHPRVLDAVEGVLGPNILIWGSDWFVKFAGDPAFISWHQDGAYWGLTPPKVTTAWIALSPSTLESGCMQVMPRTQNTQFAQRETFARDNALSRGQEIALEVDESQAVAMALHPGEMSLHHIGIAHGSKANTSTYARVGIAVRYIAPEVVQKGSEKQMVHVGRGEDRFGHYDIVPAPGDAQSAAEIRREADRRVSKNVLPQTKPAPV
jgi:non-heme Fe2+,alpha-ketoglutarate-dependent halogenase